MIKARRFNVVGTSGSGKSTLARRLSRVLKAPYIEMDALFWQANWQSTEDAEFFDKIKAALQTESWVLDGNYKRSTAIKWKHVDMVIWVDYSFIRTCLHALKRACHRAWTKQELWAGTGNKESFRLSFCSKDSILLWTLKTYANNRRRYAALMQDPSYAHIEFVHLRSPGACIRFLAEIKRAQMAIN